MSNRSSSTSKRAAAPALPVLAALACACLVAACADQTPGATQLSAGAQRKLMPPANDTLPLALRAQPPEVLQDVLTAVGDEVWDCRRHGGALAWVATGSEATLVDQARQSVGTVAPNRMFSGYDGSYVIGRVTGDETVTANALTWQRLVARYEAHASTGDGRFASITSVQRVLTSGGLPPEAACPQEGVSLYVPYSATYLFYRAADPAKASADLNAQATGTDTAASR